jgi:membrane protease YdiL (CAAX protease family)
MPNTTATTKPLASWQLRAQKLTSWYAKPWQVVRPFFRRFWLFLYIVVAILGSQLSIHQSPIVGVYVNAAAFILLIGLALLYLPARPLAISAAIIPITMMVTLSLPQTSVFAQVTVFYEALLVLTLVYRYVFTLDEPLQNTKLSLRGYATMVPIMLVVGQILGVISYFLLRHHYDFSVHTTLPLVAAASIVFAITEEAFFRGLIQQRANHLLHPALAAVLSLALFVDVSIGHTTILAPLVTAISGVVLVFVYAKKPNLILTIAINAMSKFTYIGLLATFVLHRL